MNFSINIIIKKNDISDRYSFITDNGDKFGNANRIVNRLTPNIFYPNIPRNNLIPLQITLFFIVNLIYAVLTRFC